MNKQDQGVVNVIRFIKNLYYFIGVIFIINMLYFIIVIVILTVDSKI